MHLSSLHRYYDHCLTWFKLLQGMDLRETLETLHPRFLGVPMVISCCRSMVVPLYRHIISNLIPPEPWCASKDRTGFQHRHNRDMGKADACHITCHVCQVLEMIPTSTFNFFALALWCSLLRVKRTASELVQFSAARSRGVKKEIWAFGADEPREQWSSRWTRCESR